MILSIQPALVLWDGYIRDKTLAFKFPNAGLIPFFFFFCKRFTFRSGCTELVARTLTCTVQCFAYGLAHRKAIASVTSSATGNVHTFITIKLAADAREEGHTWILDFGRYFPLLILF